MRKCNTIYCCCKLKYYNIAQTHNFIYNKVFNLLLRGIMKTSIILAHPDKNSFNHAIAETAKLFLKEREHTVFFHDLYKENFNPVLPAEEIPKNGKINPVIKTYCKELTASDYIVIVHPNWWGQPPAIMKGWIDRVIRPGTAYEFEETDSGEGIPTGLLKVKYVFIFNTSNTPDKREQFIFGDPLERLWKNCIFNLCGVNNVIRKMYNIVCISTPEQRKEWLKDVHKILDNYF
jgi:NAD(P)H dehydrogenase (quinone)